MQEGYRAARRTINSPQAELAGTTGGDGARRTLGGHIEEHEDDRSSPVMKQLW